jgi:hypothetical protein
MKFVVKCYRSRDVDGQKFVVRTVNSPFELVPFSWAGAHTDKSTETLACKHLKRGLRRAEPALEEMILPATRVSFQFPNPCLVLLFLLPLLREIPPDPRARELQHREGARHRGAMG